MRGQRSNFSEIDTFSNILDAISKTINRSDIELSPACSPFNSEENEVSLQFIDGIFVTHSIPEGNSVTRQQNRLRANWVNGPDRYG